jgi:hypothetical protein
MMMTTFIFSQASLSRWRWHSRSGINPSAPVVGRSRRQAHSAMLRLDCWHEHRRNSSACVGLWEVSEGVSETLLQHEGVGFRRHEALPLGTTREYIEGMFRLDICNIYIFIYIINRVIFHHCHFTPRLFLSIIIKLKTRVVSGIKYKIAPLSFFHGSREKRLKD